MSRLLVGFSQEKNCLVNLPGPLINQLLKPGKQWEARLLVKLEWDSGSFYSAWSGVRSSSNERIEMNAELATCLRLSRDSEVIVSPTSMNELAEAGKVEVEPASSDDWEILSLNAEFLESQLLNQIAVVRKDLTWPFWVNTSTMIRVHVVKCSPEDVVKLTAGSEVIVAPKPRAVPKTAQDDDDAEKTQSSAVKRKPKILRIQGFATGANCTTVFVNKAEMAKQRWYEGLLVSLIPLAAPDDSAEDQKLKKAYLRVSWSHDVSVGHLSVHTNLRYSLGVHQYSRVRIEPVSEKFPHQQAARFLLRPLVRLPTAPTTEALTSALTDWCSNNRHSTYKAIPMVNGTVISLAAVRLSSSASSNPVASQHQFAVYCNIDEHDESGPPPPNGPEGSEALNNLGTALSYMPGMPDLGQLASLQDTYNRAMHQRRMASYLDSKAARVGGGSTEDQMESQELFVVLPNVLINEDTVKIGDIEEIDLTPTFNEATLPKLNDLGGLDKEMKVAVEHLSAILDRRMMKTQLGVNGQGSLLIHGQHGSGKTMLAAALAQNFQSDPRIKAYICKLNCAEMSGARHDQISRRIGGIFKQAILSQPSIVILDDLDLLLPNEQQGSPQGWQMTIHVNILLGMFTSWLNRLYLEKHRIAVIATGQSDHAIHNSLHHPHYFRSLVACPPPSKAGRVDILTKIFNKRGIPLNGLDLHAVAMKCEGYLGSDLAQLLDRALHNASIRLIETIEAPLSRASSASSLNSPSLYSAPKPLRGGKVDSDSLTADISALPLATKQPTPEGDSVVPNLSLEDIHKAQEEYVPVALKGVKLHKSSVEWQDVGGLAEVRTILKQTLEWPTKYSFLFKSTPIRHRSGILLYGPSGCGKTLLACAVAKECSLNFISVKGPELLNKYIGASEQGVRDLFTRAAAAAPAILFFDEFDAIAPRRGHDNTGVTDRVVNQLLTQLDGVEAIEGVYVLAATSRPDLIDPALLRPGRLDKALYVGIPSTEERSSILRALSRKSVIGQDVDWNLLASWTEGYTGADLQALLYNAQLEAIHATLDNLRSTFSSQSATTADGKFKQFKLDESDKEVLLTTENRSQILKKLEAIKSNLVSQAKEAETGREELEQHAPPAVTLGNLKKAFEELVPSISPSEKKRYQSMCAVLTSAAVHSLTAAHQLRQLLAV